MLSKQKGEAFRASVRDGLGEVTDKSSYWAGAHEVENLVQQKGKMPILVSR